MTLSLHEPESIGKRQQESQAMTAKHQSESLQSTWSAVSTQYKMLLLCIHVQMFEVHNVAVICSCTT